MSDFQIVGNEFFHQLHRAVTNVQYYNALAGKYDSRALYQSISAAICLIFGLLVAAYPWARRAIAKAKEKQGADVEAIVLGAEVRALVWGFGIAAIGFIIGLVPFGTWATKYGQLSDEWTGVRMRVESAEKRLYAVTDRKGVVPEHLKDELADVTRYGDLLVSRDKDEPDKTLLKDSWERTNEIIYGDGIRTKEQAEEKFAELQKQKRIPIWPFPPEQSPKKNAT
jgi:hypothetical protein